MRRMYSFVVRFYKLLQHIEKSVSVLISKASSICFLGLGESVPRSRTSRPVSGRSEIGCIRASTCAETVCLRIPFPYQSVADRSPAYGFRVSAVFKNRLKRCRNRGSSLRFHRHDM